MQKIDPAALLPMDRFAGELLRIELAYASPDNLLFGERIYRRDATLWLHRILAEIVVEAAKDCLKTHGKSFILYDGLRPSDAQAKMMETQRVKDNPHWLREPRLLSAPGGGGHPRGMAVDLGLEDENGLVDMGTPFDFLAEDSSPTKNPAHRNYIGLNDTVRANREMLTGLVLRAAEKFNVALLPLPEEWWDFRLMPEFFNAYAPLADSDLPPEMRMLDFPASK